LGAAGAVREGPAPARRPARRDRDAGRGGPARTGRFLRLRGAGRFDGAASTRADRAAAGRRGGGWQGRERRRAGGHRRAEPAPPRQQGRGPPARAGARRRPARAARRDDAGSERTAAGATAAAAAGQSVSISEPFIRRPVATTLLT